MTSRAARESRISLPSLVLRGRIVLAIVGRDFDITRSYRLPFILDAFFGVLNLAVYFFISRTFEGVRSADLHGAPTYFAFAAVGIVLGLVVEAASEGIADRLRDEQLTGTLEALVTYPLTLAEICLGLVGFPFLFALARALLYLVVAGIWMDLDLSRTSWLGLVCVLIASGSALTALGILAGAIVLVLKRGIALVGMAVFGMTLLSGSVFPIAVLPDWLEPLGKILPLRFALDGVRAALFLGDGWATDAAVLVGFSALGIPVAVWIFGRALLFAERAGSLAQY
jgi:ABC-2 type transport system permease protein